MAGRNFFKKSVLSLAALAGVLLPSAALAATTPAFTLTSAATTAFPSTALGATSAAQVITLQTTRAVTITNAGIAINSTYGGYQEFVLGTVSGCTANGTTSTASGTTCSLSVTFSPKYPGPHQATLTITDTTGLVYNLGLTGFGDGAQASLIPGSVTTLAGSAGGIYYSGDGGAASSARIAQPYNVFVDAANNVYMADYPSNNVRVIYRSGAGLACLIQIENPAMFGMPIGSTSCTGATSAPVAGDMYTIEGDTTGPVAITTTAPLAHASGDLDNVLATTVSSGKAAMQNPYGIAVDGAGDVFVSDYNNYNVRVIYAGGEAAACLIEIENPTLFGLTSTATSCAGATSAPQVGFIYTLVSTPGTVSVGHSGDGGKGTSALMAYGQGVYVTASDDVFFTDYSTQTTRLPHIRVLYNGGAIAKALITAENPTITSPVTGYVYNIVGAAPTGVAASSSGDGGLASSAYFVGSRDLIIDKDGNLVFTEYYTALANKVRVVYMGGASMANLITKENPTVTTPQVGYVYLLAGSAANGYSGDGGLGTAAQMYGTSGVAEDAAGDLYVSEEYNYVLRKISAATGLVSTIAGNHTQNVVDGNALSAAVLYDPWGNAWTEAGTIMFADYDRFRQLSATAPSQAFSTAVAPNSIGTELKTVLLTNTGSQALTLTSLTISTNFMITASGSTVYSDCTSTTVLSPGQTCAVGVVLAPVVGGAVSGTLTFTDNALGVMGATQTAAFTGTGALQTQVALSSSVNPTYAGNNVTYTAVVSVSSGQDTTGAPTLIGTVKFTDGTTTLGTISIDSTGTATYTQVAISGGTHTIKAAFTPDTTVSTNYSTSSMSLSEVVTAVATSTTVTSSNPNADQGSSVTLTATVTVPAGQTIPTGTPTLSGTVTFTDTTAGTVVATGVAINTTGVATTPAALSVGSHVITAVFTPSSVFYASSTGTFTQIFSAPSWSAATTSYGVSVITGGSVAVPFSIVSVGGYKGTVTGSCSGLPSYVSCLFSPSSVTFTGGDNTVSDTVNIVTSTQSIAEAHTGRTMTELAGVLGAALLFFLPRRRRLASLLMLAVGCALTLGLSGCSNVAPTANRGTFNINVTFTDGATSYTQAITVSVLGTGSK